MQDVILSVQDLEVEFTLRGKTLHAIRGISLDICEGESLAIVGESGCGKSTIASILMGRNRGYTGSVTVGGVPLCEISEESLLERFTYVSHQSYLFQGTVRENLLMGCPNAGEDALWMALEQVKLADSEKRRDWIPGWQRRRRISLAASASGWRLLAHCSTTARCTSSMKPAPTLTWKVKPMSWLRFIGWRKPRL